MASGWFESMPSCDQVQGNEADVGTCLKRNLHGSEILWPWPSVANCQRRSLSMSSLPSASGVTGARRGEILSLRWQHVNFERGCLELPDSKTGEKEVFLPAAAMHILANLPRVDGNPYVIVGRKPGAHLVNLKDPCQSFERKPAWKDVRLHDLRHSFASVGARAGMSLPILGALLGHRETATTARYAHLSDDPRRLAADAMGKRLQML